VLRRAVELEVNFIDTADSYGPYVSEELISEALFPYPKGLVIATKAAGIVQAKSMDSRRNSRALAGGSGGQPQETETGSHRRLSAARSGSGCVL